MNILFVSQYYAPEPFSNARIVREMVALGHQVEVMTAVPNYPQGEFYPGYETGAPRTENVDGILVHRVRTIARGRRKLTLALNYLGFTFFGSIKALIGQFRKPDLVFLSQLSPVFMALPAALLARRFKVPLVYWVQDIWPESATHTLGLRNPLITGLLSAVSGWLYRRADLVLVQSEAFPPMIERFGIPADRIEVFPNTAAEGFRPMHPDPESPEAAMMPDTGFRVMFAGNIGEAQDFDTVIAAARRLADRGQEVHWIILGTGRDLERVKAEVASQGLDRQFHFLGRFPETAMPGFFAHADAMLLCLKRNDIFALTVPYKLQGYLAAGKPVVAALDGEGARVVRVSGAGIVAPAEDSAGLAAAVEELMNDFPARKADYSAASRRYFEQNYAAEVVFGKLDKALNRARDEGRGA